MKFVMFLKVLFTLIFFRCGSSPSNKTITEVDSLAAEKRLVSNAAKVAKIESELNVEFVFSNDSLEQRILINDIEENRIEFEYFINNKTKGCHQVVRGVAIDKNPDMDPELDENEEGFGYPAIEYLYEEEECIVAIRRSMIEKDKVQISSNCSLVEKSCPIESVGILRKK